ncbi:MAG: family 16 glycosylhydrolase [Porticoccaceae bacterium]
MKSILKTFNAGFISNFALIGILSVLTSACGSNADSNDPRRFDDTGPAITLNTRPEVIDEEGNVTQYAIGETVELDYMQSYDELGVTVRDLWDVNNVEVTTTQRPSLDTSVLGTYYVDYYAVDTSNNQSETLTRTIVVEDRTGPEISISGPNPLIIQPGELYTQPTATFTDVYDTDKNNTPSGQITASGDVIDETQYGSYTVVYSAADNAGNVTTKDLIVLVEPTYLDEVVVFRAGNYGPDFDGGSNAYDSAINYSTCSTSDGCPSISFELVDDTSEEQRPEKVLEISHADTNAFAGVFIESSQTFDLRGAHELGKLVFDVWSENGISINVNAGCVYPCESALVTLPDVGNGEWETVTIPITQLLNDKLNAITLGKSNTIGLHATSQTNESFRVDNIRWMCVSTCEGAETGDKEYTPWVKADKDDPDAYVAPTEYDGYTLVWSDEFDGTEVDTNNWNIDTGCTLVGCGNQELQHYRPENASIEDGQLVISADIQRSGDDNLPGFEQYSSSKLTTKDKFEFKQGRVDIRAVVAEGQGMWSAGWMLGAENEWPYTGEIDIFDTIGGVRGGVPQEDMIVHNAYYNAFGPFDPARNDPALGYSSSNFNNEQAGYGENRIDPNNPSNDGETYSNRFHVFSIDWNEERIRFLVDGVAHTEDFRIQYDNACQYTEYVGDTRSCIEQSFDHTFYMILNVAVGGTWPGSPDETTQFPRGMLVDYVRVYQKDTDNDGVADFDLDGETQLDADPNDPNVGAL